MKGFVCAAAAVPVILAASLSAPALAQGGSGSFVQAGDFLVRGRGIVVTPDEDVRSISVIGGDVGIDTDVKPEVDFTYFFTDNIAVELIAAVSRHDVTAKNTALGDVDVGELLLLPPTLTLQYHLPMTKEFKPYIGVGINATFFIDEDAGGGAVTDINAKDTLGWGVQAGFDYWLGGPWMLNADAKKLFIDTKVRINGGAIVANGVDIDPWVFGFGFGYRF